MCADLYGVTCRQVGWKGVIFLGLLVLGVLSVHLLNTGFGHKLYFTKHIHAIALQAQDSKRQMSTVTPNVTVSFFASSPPPAFENDTSQDRRWQSMPPYNPESQRRFEERRQRLKQECQKIKNLMFVKLTSEALQLAPRRLNMCLIPKIGTSFSRHLRKDILRLTKLPPYGSRPKSFFVVREPYSRMVSGYIGKIVTHQLWWGYFGRYIIQRHRRGATKKEIRCGSDVTFPEFIKYFIHAQKTGQMKNVHFVPIHEQCGICKREYDFIGHLETFTEDMAHMLRTVNISASLDFSDEELTLAGKAETIVRQREKIKMCENMCDILERVWWSFKARGLIANDIALPVTPDQCDTITPKEFSSAALKAHRQSKTHIQKSKQKREALVQLYLHVPLQDRLKVQKLLKPDFDLFGYESQPKDIFPELS